MTSYERLQKKIQRLGGMAPTIAKLGRSLKAL